MALAVINVKGTACRARSKSLLWALGAQAQNYTTNFLCSLRNNHELKPTGNYPSISVENTKFIHIAHKTP